MKRSLGTKKLLAEIQSIVGPDEFGRRAPGYALIHRALVELRDRLKAESN